MPYFHVVFTIPAPLAALALGNKKTLYALLFRAVSETLLTLARDPRHLGAELGFLAILHTSTQQLLHHPHIHCVVPGGGLSPDGTSWIPSRPDFFLPVRVLSRLFRGKLLAFVADAARAGDLRFSGPRAHLADSAARRAWLRHLRSIDWVVYSKPPFGSPEQVLKYLARYTHRVAISNARLADLSDDTVTFRWRDRAAGNAPRTTTLPGPDFLRLFLLHVMPKRFVRIRYFGFLANRVRHDRLAHIRRLLDTPPPGPPTDRVPFEPAEPLRCPRCAGALRFVKMVPPELVSLAASPVPQDTS